MRVDLHALEPMRGPVGGNQRRGALSFRHRRLDRAGRRFGGAVLGLRGARQQNKRQERREVTQGIHRYIAEILERWEIFHIGA